MSNISIICNKNLDGIAKCPNIKFTKNNYDVKIGILNLMPFKDEIEMQFFNILGRYDLNVKVEFLYVESHLSKNTSMDYIKQNYIPLSLVKNRDYDGIIITGAPLENFDFEEVKYWEELKEIFHIDIPSIYICWASQAGLYLHHGIEKFNLNTKLFGIYSHSVNKNNLINLESFYAPHSRNTYNKKIDIIGAGLDIIAESKEAGVYISSAKDLKRIYISGHGEYQKERLDYEYQRDLKEIPKNYYRNNNPEEGIIFNWDNHREKLYKNWLKFLIKRG